MGNSDRRVNSEGLMTRKIREVFDDIMDSTASDLMSQVFGKFLHETYKREQLVREVATEMQALSTATYHLARDGMHLQRQRLKHENSRRILEDEILGAFKTSTKYSTIFKEVESVFQEFFDVFMKKHHIGIGYSGKPSFKISYSDVKFSTKGNFLQEYTHFNLFLR